MNTKLLFYCTHLQYGQFEKVIFETVLSGSIEDNNEAKDWLEIQIPSLCDEFDFSLVFDWIVIGYESTELEISDTKIIKSIPGELVFETPKKARKPRTVKPKVAKTEATTVDKPKKKEYQSVWIDPYGKTYKIGFADHNNFAGHWLKENNKEAYRHVTNSFNRYYYEYLQDHGWTRILGWTDPPTFVIPSRISPNVKNAIREYCISQKVSYEFFPEILKS